MTIKVGSVKDLLVDDNGRFRYVVVDTGPWILGKNVLLPIGLANFDYQRDRIYVRGLSRQQIENLPEYKGIQNINDQYENRVQEQYRPIAKGRSNRQFMATSAERSQPVERSMPVEESARVEADRAAIATRYDREPSLYGMSEQDNHRPLKLYEERLVTNRHREKTGEVRVGKHVVTETQEVTAPVERERVVVERRDAQGRPVAGDEHQFEDQEIARMDVYEDQVDIEKQPYVREEVSVRKETDRDVVRAKEKVRREELDIDTEGNPDVRR
jgi:uncharacterized protein (TIGR02271 family)